MRLWLIPVVLFLAWLGLNAGTLLDALAYREMRATARRILPADWQTLRYVQPDSAQIAAMMQSMTPAQTVALNEVSGRFETGSQGVVLRLPRGLDTEELVLFSGCFRFARHGLSFIVWQIETRLHCL